MPTSPRERSSLIASPASTTASTVNSERPASVSPTASSPSGGRSRTGASHPSDHSRFHARKQLTRPAPPRRATANDLLQEVQDPGQGDRRRLPQVQGPALDVRGTR